MPPVTVGRRSVRSLQQLFSSTLHLPGSQAVINPQSYEGMPLDMPQRLDSPLLQLAGMLHTSCKVLTSLPRWA
jgi:hypothetical protein